MKRIKAGHADNRISKNYEEAVMALGEEKLKVYGLGATLASEVLDRIATRIEWTCKENERREKEAIAKDEPPPQPNIAMAELEALNRIVGAMNKLTRDVVEKGDPSAGAMEIVRVLEEARKEYGDGGKETLNGNG